MFIDKQSVWVSNDVFNGRHVEMFLGTRDGVMDMEFIGARQCAFLNMAKVVEVSTPHTKRTHMHTHKFIRGP